MKTKIYPVQPTKKSKNVVTVRLDLTRLPSETHKNLSKFKPVRFEDKRKKKPKYKNTYDMERE